MSISKINTSHVFYHALGWAIFILYEISYLRLSGIPGSRFGDYFLHYLVNIGLFYFNVAGFKFIYRKSIERVFSIVIFLFSEMLAYLFLQYIAFRLLALIYGYVVPANLAFFSVREIYRGIYFMLFSIGYWLSLRVASQEQRLLEAENEKLKQEFEHAELERNLVRSRNAYLISQLNPHLLFNTLSFIYNSVRKLSEVGAEAVLLLSDMMRYALAEPSANGTISLRKEIDHIQNLIRLNQLRAGSLYIMIEVGDIPSELTILPLVLLSIVENIFKHGDLSKPDQPAKIAINYSEGRISFFSQNLLRTTRSSSGWGIGISNANERLEAFYGPRYRLEIIEDEQTYATLLEIVI